AQGEVEGRFSLGEWILDRQDLGHAEFLSLLPDLGQHPLLVGFSNRDRGKLVRRSLQPTSTGRAPVYPAFSPPGDPRAAIRQHTEEIIGCKDLGRLLHLLTKNGVAILRRRQMSHRIYAAASEHHAQNRNAVRPDGSARLSVTENCLVIDLVASPQGVVEK